MIAAETPTMLGDAQIAHGHATLEAGALPAYLPRQRWFAAKGEDILEARLGYTVPLPGTAALMFAEAEVRLPTRSVVCALPLAVCWHDDGVTLQQQASALARVRRGAATGVLTDAFAVDDFAFRVLDLLRDAATLSLDAWGQLNFAPSQALATLDLPRRPALRRLSAEQSNSSLVLGNRLVLKLVRHVAGGVHPESEISRVLTERGYRNAAPYYGDVARISMAGVPHTIMLAQGFIANQGDGWDWTLTRLAGLDAADRSALNRFASAVGRRLAELHAVLAQPCDDPAFAPEPADRATRQSWADGAIAQFDQAMDVLSAPLAADLLANAGALRRALRALAERGDGAMCLRVHGDFHLGQILVADNDAYIVDFEGEPARSLSERRQKSCALRDVAGLLRSFDYAAATIAGQKPERSADLLRWRDDASECFLDAYTTTLADAPHAVAPARTHAALLDLFLIEKAAYELRYEATNRPDWLGIPLRGLRAIATRVLQNERLR